MSTIVIPVGANIQSYINSNPAGTTFQLSAGTYYGQSILAQSNDQFIGDPSGGTVLSGAMVLSNWTQSGNYWTVSGLPAQLTGTGSTGANPLANYDNDLFIDNVLYHRVSSLSQVAAGTWYFDPTTNSVYISANPTGHKVEYSATSNLTYDNGSSGVVFKNITVEKYASAASNGAIHGVQNWTFINDTFQWNHGVGLVVGANTVVQGGHYNNNGQSGIEGYMANGAQILGAEIAGNNYAGYDPNWEAGGMKFASSANVVVSGCNVHDNNGNGVWADVDSSGWTISGNTVTNNAGNGIMYEISHGSTKIDNNTVSGNAESGIYISNSDGVEASGNTVKVGSGNTGINGGIDIINDARGSGPNGVWQSVNDTIQGNTIIHTSDTANDGIYVYQALPAQPNDVWNNNTYYVPNANGTYWEFGTTDYSWSALRQSTAYESTGTEIVGLPASGGGSGGPFPDPSAGTGSDTLVLSISEDAYANGDGTSDAAGDATFTVSVDGKQVGGTFTALASHSAGQDQTFTLKGNWAPGTHTIVVNFLNDAYGGSPTTDRNLYVDALTYDGINTGQSAAIYGSITPASFTVTDTTPVATPSPNGTTITSASAAPIIDQAGNAWSLVQSASNGLQIAVNGTVDPVTSDVTLLETLNGSMVQENSYGTWYSETQNNDSWALIVNPNPAPPVTFGTGSDTLVLSISEDAYANGDGTSDAAGDARFTVSVDGNQIAGTFTATASHSAGQDQAFTLKGNWAPGTHTVAVDFLNDAYAGTPSTDRNLYVDAVTYDGTNTKQSAALMGNGSKNFSVTDTTAIPPPVTGSGADTLVLKVSEDAYVGNAQFTVSVDGKQLGGTFTATTLHSSGGSQAFAFAGDFGTGQHAVLVNFTNDAYGGSPTTDRNLYVNDIIYKGTDTGLNAAIYGGASTFTLSGGTTPSVSETGDHGSLQKNLSQSGTYTVASDTFVLTSGNAATVTLGTGSSSIAFVGASSVKLTGGSGRATITADGGANTFTAGAGSLDVTGGPGKDAYIFHASSGALTMEDFSLSKGDTLTIDKSLKASLHQATDGMGGTMLTLGTSTTQSIDIRGLAALSTTNITFA